MAEIEIINGPLSVYWAPLTESYPAIGAAPAGNWALVATSGAHNYTDDGVVISHEKSVEYFRALASPYPRKAFITEADIIVKVTIADFSLTQLRLALNQNTVTSDTGFDYMSMDIGLDITEIALLIRGTGKSPLIAGGNLQFNIDKVVEEGSREWTAVKGGPIMSELNFRVIYNEGASYPVGRILAADA